MKPGEKGLHIIRPIVKARRTDEDARLAETDGDGVRKAIVGFGLVTVFAVDQTDGAPFERATLPDVSAPELFELSVEKLRAAALRLPGAPVSHIEVRGRRAGDPEGAHGWMRPDTKEVVVLTDGRPRAHQFKTLCHELAHCILHPVGEHHARAEAEVEAESTAFVVCHALGLDTGSYSFPYVKTWARGNDALLLLQKTGDRILKASRMLLDAIAPELPEASEQGDPETSAAA